MKNVFLIFVIFSLACTGIAAAEVVPVAVVATPSFVEWFMSSLAPIFGIMFAVSELMSMSPWFKGNGIVDSLVKFFALMVQFQKNDTKQVSQ